MNGVKSLGMLMLVVSVVLGLVGWVSWWACKDTQCALCLLSAMGLFYGGIRLADPELLERGE